MQDMDILTLDDLEPLDELTPEELEQISGGAGAQASAQNSEAMLQPSSVGILTPDEKGRIN